MAAVHRYLAALRHAARPSWPAFGLWLGCFGWRLAAWWLRKAWLPEWPAGREFAKGVAWDTALVVLVLALARALHAASTASALQRLARRAGLGLLGAAVASAVVVRALDLVHCAMTRSHWTADAFLYFDAGFVGSLAEPRGFAGLALLTAVLVATVAALGADARRHTAARRAATAEAPSGGPWSRPTALAPWLWVLLALGPAAWAVRDGVRYPAAVNQPRLVPEVNFALRWRYAHSEPPIATRPPPLPPTLFAKFQRLGLLPAEGKPDAPWPLLREKVSKIPFPWPLRPDAPERPNVVLTLLESTNAEFVHGLSGRHPGLMPQTSALATRMMRATRFFNTSSPTIAAMVTALCSVHPPSHPHDLQPGSTVDGRAAYTCLADLLRVRGYRTVFVQAASKTITGKEFFLRTHGFDEVYGREDIEPTLHGRPSGPWGPHDGDLVAWTRGLVERLERDGKPFLLVMLTLDSHEPGMAGPDCVLPQELAPGVSPEARQLLAAYHCSDRAVGELGRFLLDGPRAHQTVWLLTADHAAFPDLVPEGVLTDPTGRSASARVPFLLHDPRHALPPELDVLGGTQDVAPTLLHLLGATDMANSLTGRSLFGRRPALPFLVGRVGERLALARSRDAAVELPPGSLLDWCAEGRTLIEAMGERWTACDMQAWLVWQDALWDGRRLFPAKLYHGGDGVDRHDLLQRQESNAAQ
jgi:hypothetical protein